jgi:3-isopropylmalate/(R)-2-methylmalate dehydratase small subunit
MSELVLEGRARKVGDDVNTDYIISSSRKMLTLDPGVLKEYLLEGLDPGFAASVEPGDLLVAGRNFGCGSAMEVAATVIAGAGIRAVLARSFARTYYRNAINNGVLPVECDTTSIQEGDRLVVGVKAGETRVLDVTRDQRIVGAALPAIMLDILDAGGLVPYFRAHGKFRMPGASQRPTLNPRLQ